jgi:putative PIN family toxin of toxin-antitoxin system
LARTTGLSKARLTRVVLDTNVLVSALLFEGPARRLVELWRTGVIAPLASAAMLRELARVLAYPKFRLSAEEIEGLLHEEFLPFVIPVVVDEVPAVVAQDPSDDEFLACALAGRADAVLSGDRHLLDLGRQHGVAILSLRELLERS